MSHADPDFPPAPASAADAARWTELRRRRRFLSGQWHRDLEDRILEHFGDIRREAIGPQSLAKNVFRKLCHTLAVNYLRPPTVRHLTGDLPLLTARGGLLDRAGVWPLLRELQVELVGLREMLLRLDWSPDLGRPVVRSVTPDLVVAWGHPDDPLEPVEVHELRHRSVAGRAVWTWEQWSIRDPQAPYGRVVVVDDGGREAEDVTHLVYGSSLTAEAYPWRWTQGERAGRPFLPYVIYHAIRKNLWNAQEGMEVVEGTLDVATAWTWVQHVIFRASWPQRWSLGAYPAGARPSDSGSARHVPTDPTSLLEFVADGQTQNPQIGQFQTSADPEAMVRAVAQLETAIADFDGLGASHVVRDSANPWSAAALSITNEARREAQRRYASELRPSDVELVERVACMTNVALGGALPESGYMIEYRAIPLSPEELKTRREHNAVMIAQGRMSIVDAFCDEHPELTRDEAITELKRIAKDNASFGVKPGTAPSPIVSEPTPQGQT